MDIPLNGTELLSNIVFFKRKGKSMGADKREDESVDLIEDIVSPTAVKEPVSKASRPGGRARSSKPKRSAAEWVTLTLSSLFLMAIVGLVLYDWQLTKNLPPSFRIELVEQARFTEGRYYVPFTLRNTGGRIARTVQVIAELQLPDGTDENGEQQFDFLSGNERKKGGFVFEHNPQDGDLVIRVASFGLP